MNITVRCYGSSALAVSPKLGSSFLQSMLHSYEKYLAWDQGKTLMEAGTHHADYMHYGSE